MGTTIIIIAMVLILAFIANEYRLARKNAAKRVEDGWRQMWDSIDDMRENG